VGEAYREDCQKCLANFKLLLLSSEGWGDILLPFLHFLERGINLRLEEINIITAVDDKYRNLRLRKLEDKKKLLFIPFSRLVFFPFLRFWQGLVFAHSLTLRWLVNQSTYKKFYF
jgi:hypothetical protein